MTDERRLGLARMLLRMDAKAHLRASVRHDGVDRFVHREHVDPVTVIAGPDQSRSPRPPVPKNGTPGGLRQLAELVVGVRGAGPLLAPQPGDGDVAVLVVHRRRARE